MEVLQLCLLLFIVRGMSEVIYIIIQTINMRNIHVTVSFYCHLNIPKCLPSLTNLVGTYIGTV